MNMVVSFATSSHRRLYAPEVAGNTWVYIVDLHTAASAVTACASPFAVAQRRGRYAAGDLIPEWDRLAAGVAVCVLYFFSVWYIGWPRRLSLMFCLSFLRLPCNQPDQWNVTSKPRQGSLQAAAVTEAQERPIKVRQRMMQQPGQVAAQNRLRMNLRQVRRCDARSTLRRRSHRSIQSRVTKKSSVHKT